MIEQARSALVGQYGAALAMLAECIAKCPADKWHGAVGNFPFWHAAYHVLHFTDLYLSRDEASYLALEFFREGYQYFERRPDPPHEPIVPEVPYERDVLARRPTNLTDPQTPRP